MLQLAYMRCGSKELAEDLVQETCIKAYNSYLNKEHEIESPKSWLFRILINTHIDHTRKKQFATTQIEDYDFPDNKTPIKEVETSLFFKDLSFALKELDSDQRALIYFADINEYSYKEISKLLEIPLGTVMSRLHRARQTLRKVLSSQGYSKDYIREGEKQ